MMTIRNYNQMYVLFCEDVCFSKYPEEITIFSLREHQQVGGNIFITSITLNQMW